MHIFYTPDILTNSYQLSEEESKHCIKVLRLRMNDEVNLVDGKGGFYLAKITDDHPKKTILNILDHKKEYGKRNHYLHIAIAPTKNIERFEWFLEKATEIGVHEITPIICDHSERKVTNNERFDKILLTAMKQSNELYLPKLNPATTFKEFIKLKNEGVKLIAHCEETNKRTLKSILKPNEDITMLIGPEGDFSEKEIALALENNFTAVSLGNTRLRTETAAIVACHSVVFVNEE